MDDEVGGGRVAADDGFDEAGDGLAVEQAVPFAARVGGEQRALVAGVEAARSGDEAVGAQAGAGEFLQTAPA